MTDIQQEFDELFDFFEQQLSIDGFSALEEKLDLIAKGVSETPLVLAVSALRLTWSARRSISNWCSVRDAVSQELQAQGHDSKSVLTGLYDPEISGSAVGAASYAALEPPLPFAPPDFEGRVQQAIQKSRAGWQKAVSTKRYQP